MSKEKSSSEAESVGEDREKSNARTESPASGPLSAGEMGRRLRKKYHGADFELCFEVRNDAGFNADRSCDALGIGLWPSRGCHIYGFEIKVSRSDWLNELKNAAKAEAFVPYCDYWFVVAGARDIVRKEELPVGSIEAGGGWGLIVPRGDGLEIIVDAARREDPKPMPRGMLAAFVKRASTQNPSKEVLGERFAAGKKEGIAIGETRANRNDKTKDYEALRAAVDSFRRQTGIAPEYYHDPLRLKAALAIIDAGAEHGIASQLTRTAENLRQLALKADEAAKDAVALRTDARKAVA